MIRWKRSRGWPGKSRMGKGKGGESNLVMLHTSPVKSGQAAAS